MSDTLGRLVARVPAATSSTSNLFASSRAMLAGAWHLFLASDINHLMMVSATRPVFTHQGMAGFYRGPAGTPSSPPTPDDVTWLPPGPDAGALNYRVPLRVDSYGASALPTLRLRCWVKAPPSGTESVGVVLCVTADGSAPTSSARYASAVVTSTTGVDVDVEIPLTVEDLRAQSQLVTLGETTSGAPVIGEPYAESTATAWIGFYNTSNKNSDTADALGIVLSLEMP